MELGHWVTGSMGHLGQLSRPGHRVIILTQCETRVFRFSKKNAQNAKKTLEFITEQGHRVNWVSRSLDFRVTGSLGHKM